MFRCLNPDDLGISGRQSELIELALTFGFRGLYVDIDEITTRARTRGKEHACRFLASANVRIGLFHLPVDLDTDEASFASQLASLEENIELFQEIGATRCETTISPTSASLAFPENFELHRHRIGNIAETLAKGEIQLGLALQAAACHRENAEYQFVHQADDLLTLIKTISAKNIGVALDTWNWQVGGGGLDQLRELSGNQLVSVKLSNIPAEADQANISEDQRTLPGSEGLVDTSSILRVLGENGFEGPVFVAAHPSHLTGMTREAIVQRARNVLDQQWSEAGLDAAGKLTVAAVES